MSQYSAPGVQKQHQGADFTGTPGLLVPVSGGVANKAVAYSELSAAQTAIDATIAALEASLNAVDTNLQSSIDNLSLGLSEASVNSLIQAALVGGVRYRGVALADAVDANAATGLTAYQTGDMFRITSGGSSAFGFALSVGDFVVRNAANGWDKIDSTDPSLSAGDSSITVTQTGENSYTVAIASTITDRITAAESSITALTSGLAAAVAVNATQTSAIAAIESVNTAQSTAISVLETDLAAAVSVNATQTSAISTLTSGLAAAVAINTTQSSDIAGLVSYASNTANDLNAEIARATAAESSIFDAIDSLTGVVDSVSEINDIQNTNIIALQGDLSSLDSAVDQALIDIAARATADAVKTAMADFYAYTHQMIILSAEQNGYVTRYVTSSDGVFRTDFYYDMPDSLAWAVVEINESSAPYDQVAPPMHQKLAVAPVGTAGADVSGNFMRFSFFGGAATGVAADTIQVYLNRFFAIGNTTESVEPYISIATGS
ncbi:MAG: hypothetical protein KME11_05115 [Timaviella obliquedivisa GSE-PSE-MK23-08B]|jgi:hypothetical protein|nr:hypothetical protein [Timaviella obliquedivisa GSE-PSE-MK23-08B]